MAPPKTVEELLLEQKLKNLEAQILGGVASGPPLEDEYGIPKASSILGTEYYYQRAVPDEIDKMLNKAAAGKGTKVETRQDLIDQLIDLKTQREIGAMVDSGLSEDSINYEVIRDRFAKEAREQYIAPTTTATFGRDFLDKTAPQEVAFGIDVKPAPPIELATGIEPSITGPVSPFRPQQYSTRTQKGLNKNQMLNYLMQTYPDADPDMLDLQVAGMEAAYTEELIKGTAPAKALEKALEEIGNIDNAPDFKAVETAEGKRYQSDNTAFQLQVSGQGTSVPEYTPTQMAYVKKTIERPYWQFWSANRDAIGQEEVDIVSFPYGATGSINVPKEVFDYLTATNPKTTKTLVSPQFDAAVRGAKGVNMSAGRGKAEDLNMGGALTSVRAKAKFGDPDAWFLDPDLAKEIKQNPDNFINEGWFTDQDYMGKQAETTLGYSFRMGMAPLNALSTAAQEYIIEPVVEPVVAGSIAVGFETAAKLGAIPEADYFTEAITEPSVLGTARAKQRAIDTPDYAASPIMASIAKNKGLTGEYMDVSNALGLEGLPKYIVVGGGFAGDILSPDIGILIAGSKALKGGSDLIKAQKALNQSTSAAEIAKVMSSSGIQAFVKDTNFLTAPFREVPKVAGEIVGATGKAVKAVPGVKSTIKGGQVLAEKTAKLPGVKQTVKAAEKVGEVAAKPYKVTAKKIADVYEATESYADVRALVGAKTAQNLEAARMYKGQDYVQYRQAVNDAGLGDSNFIKALEKEIDTGKAFDEVIADLEVSFFKGAEDTATEYFATQKYLDEYADGTKFGTEEAGTLPNPKINKDLLDDIAVAKFNKRLNRLDAAEIDQVAKLVDFHYGRQMLFEAAPSVKGLDNVVAVTRKTYAHEDRVPEIIAKANASDTGKILGEIIENKVGRATRERGAPSEFLGERTIGGFVEPTELKPYFALSQEQAQRLQMVLFGDKIEAKLPRSTYNQMLIDINSGKLFFDDVNLLRNITLDTAASVLERGVYKTADLSRLPPKMQKKFLDAPGVRENGFLQDFLPEQWERLAERTRRSTVPEKAYDDVATFEQRRLYEEVKQETSAMDIKLRSEINNLRGKGAEAEELRELYGLDPKVIPTSEEALGAAIVGPRAIPDLKYTVDGKQVGADEYLEFVQAERESVVQQRLQQQELLRRLPEEKERLAAAEKLAREEAQLAVADFKKELELEFKETRKAEAKARDAKLKQVRATTKEAKADAFKEYTDAMADAVKARKEEKAAADATKTKAIEDLKAKTDAEIKKIKEDNEIAIAKAEEALEKKIEGIDRRAQADIDEAAAGYQRRDNELVATRNADLEAQKEVYQSRIDDLKQADDIDFIDEAADMSEALKAYRRSYKQAQQDAAQMFDDSIKAVEDEYDEMFDLVKEDAIDTFVARLDTMTEEQRLKAIEDLFSDIQETDMARRAGLKQADFDVRSFRAQLGWSNRRTKQMFQQKFGEKFDNIRQAINAEKKKAFKEASQANKEAKQQIRESFAEQRAANKEEIQKYNKSVKYKRQLAINQQNNQFKNLKTKAKEELKSFRDQAKRDMQQVRLRSIQNQKAQKARAEAEFSTKKSDLQRILKAENDELVAIRDFAEEQIQKTYDETIKEMQAEKAATREERVDAYREESDALREQYKQKRAEAVEAATRDIPGPTLGEAADLGYAGQAQLGRLYDTADWALGRLFYHVKDKSTVTDRVVGLNQFAQRNTFLSKKGKEAVGDAVQDFVVRAYDNPARYWDHFSELITEYVKVLGDETNLAPGIKSEMIEKKFAAMQKELQNEVSLGMYYWAEGDRIVNKKLLQAVNEDVIIASTEQILDRAATKFQGSFDPLLTDIANGTGRTKQQVFEDELKAYITDSFNRPYETSLAATKRLIKDGLVAKDPDYAQLLGARNWDEFDRIVSEIAYRQDLENASYVQLDLAQVARMNREVAMAGDQIIRNNNLWAKLDTNAEKTADAINDLFGTANKNVGELYLGKEVYRELQDALSNGRIKPISEQLDYLLKELPLGKRTWIAARNLFNGLMGAFYKSVLALRPQFHFNNTTTASTITYNTIGKIVGPTALAEGIKAMQASGPAMPRYYEIAVTSPTGKVYTYGDLYKAVYAGGARSEYSFITSAINDGSLIKFIEDNNTRTTGLAKPATAWMEKWAKNKVKETIKAPVTAATYPIRLAGDVGSDLMIAEDLIFRAAIMSDALKEGKTIEEATQLSRRSMYDYNDLRPNEKAAAATAFVFYSFFRQNMTNFLMQLGNPTKAKRLANTLRFDNGIERTFTVLNDDREFDKKVYMPDYTLNRSILSVQNNEDRNYYLTTPAIPTLDAMMTMAGLFASPVDELRRVGATMFSPAVRFGIGAENVFNKKTVVPDEYGEMVKAYGGYDDPFEVAQTLQIFTGGSITPQITDGSKGVELGGKYYVFPLDEAQKKNYEQFMTAIGSFGLTAAPFELTKIFAGTGPYAPYNLAERALFKPLAVTPEKKQDLYNLYSRRQAIQAEIDRLQTLQRQAQEARIENEAAGEEK